MRFRLEPTDEYMHPLEEAQNFNESMYFNVYDPAERVGGFFRLGNRANEGYAEMTACLYLPDGSVGFMYQRPEISNNDAFDAAGMRFSVETPFEALTVRYEGRLCMLTDPLEMADPGVAFRNNPMESCTVELAYRGLSPMAGGEPVNDDGTPIEEQAEQGFARGHYEQHVGAQGTIRVGDREWLIDGFGLRDHSWGPRFWQSPWWYRWLTMNFGDDFGLMVTTAGTREGKRTAHGVVFTDGRYEVVEGATIETDWAGDDIYHQRLRVQARTASRSYDITGDVLSLIPLRNRRRTPDGDTLVTRISEGMTEWRCDGRVGHGLSEYLDQIIDGRPVGAIEEGAVANS
jgi:hypothetical protein